MNRYLILLALALLLSLPASAGADFVVTIENQTLAPGQSGDVNVFIRHDGTGSNVLDLFALEFRITPFGDTASRRLEFVAPPPDTQLTDPQYVLGSDSAASLFPPGGWISSTVWTNDTYLGGDGTLSGEGVFVPTTDKLLARLQVTANTANAPQAGDQFLISLVAGPSTSFNDPNFSLVPYSSTEGVVSVQSPPLNAVPAPGALVLALSGGGVLLGYGVRRRRLAT